jgi:hypothetical protein
MTMTEVEWWASDNPQELLQHVGPRATEEKQRLFACACCRRVFHFLTRPAIQDAIHTAERFALGMATKEDLRTGWLAVRKALQRAPLTTKWEVALMAFLYTTSESLGNDFTLQVAHEVMLAKIYDRLQADLPSNHQLLSLPGAIEECTYQSRIIRDLFSYHRVKCKTDWQTWQGGQLVTLARAIEVDERYQDLPILADALEDAGCTDDTILAHCRGPGPHVPGCWVISMLLGR